MLVTRFGVSLLKVVATMDRPASHHGTARPDTKNSDVLFPARLPKKSAGTKQTSRDSATIIQSMSWRCMGSCLRTGNGRHETVGPGHNSTDGTRFGRPDLSPGRRRLT